MEHGFEINQPAMGINQGGYFAKKPWSKLLIQLVDLGHHFSVEEGHLCSLARDATVGYPGDFTNGHFQ